MVEYEEEIDTSELSDEELEEEEKKQLQKQQVKQQKTTEKQQKKTESTERFQAIYQRELSGVIDKTTGQVNTDIMSLLAEILNRLERIEQSL